MSSWPLGAPLVVPWHSAGAPPQPVGLSESGLPRVSSCGRKDLVGWDRMVIGPATIGESVLFVINECVVGENTKFH